MYTVKYFLVLLLFEQIVWATPYLQFYDPDEIVINLKNRNVYNATVQNTSMVLNNTIIFDVAPASKLLLSGNPIEELIVHTNNLYLLDARHCAIRVVKVLAEKLKDLRVDFNFLEVMTGDMITSTHLEYLSLSNNRIFAIRSGTFKGLTSLKFVDLSNNGIISLDDDSFASNLLLERLDLRHNKIVSLRLTFYGSTLSLGDNRLFVDEDFIARMPYLYVLDLSYNNLVEIPALRSGTIQHLGLRGNNISNSKANCLEQMRRLDYLDLRDNQFSSVFHPKAFMFNSIKELRLEGNPWKCRCDRLTYKFYKFIQGPPRLVDDLDLLKCSQNGQTWENECKRRWMRFRQLSEPMQKFAFGCFAFIMGKSRPFDVI